MRGGPGGDFDMQAFMQEPVEWTDEPNHQGWSESTSASVGGGVASKTVTRTYKMADGSTIVKEQTITKNIWDILDFNFIFSYMTITQQTRFN